MFILTRFFFSFYWIQSIPFFSKRNLIPFIVLKKELKLISTFPLQVLNFCSICQFQMNHSGINIEGLFTMLEGWDYSIAVRHVYIPLFNRLDSRHQQICGGGRWVLAWYYSTHAYSLGSTRYTSAWAAICCQLSPLEGRCGWQLVIASVISICKSSMTPWTMRWSQAPTLISTKIRCMCMRWLVGVVFNVWSKDTCIDEYMESRKQQIEDADIPQGILQIMNFIFSQSLNKQNITQLVGISVECNRIDLLEKALRSSQNLSDSLYQLLNLVQDFSYPEHVRERLIHLLSSLYRELNDFYGVFRCCLLLCDLQGSMFLYYSHYHYHHYHIFIH